MTKRGIRNKDGNLNKQILGAVIRKVIREREIEDPEEAKKSRVNSRILYLFEISRTSKLPRTNEYDGDYIQKNTKIYVKISHPTEKITWLVSKVKGIGDGDDLQFYGFVIQDSKRPKRTIFMATELAKLEIEGKGIRFFPEFQSTTLQDLIAKGL
jgi:hypothetical protein